ncbi:hypothetical protein [Comamonas resistens]|uniref:Uncharacterized protein n=1 Tax=Comamonas resistens TaxID=3046670 RepID=A0ABY8SWD3_9BURK|nr:hypothetical protein [Comamonas resistens]MDL5037963.1 hypothetical protein [Comamonas resistens]WHS67347.1 hypothetical protein QMY55_09620 [Comamonas resistens]
MVFTKTSKALYLTALLASAGFMTGAQAQTQPAASAANAAQNAPAEAAAPAVNVDAAAADAALRKRLQAITTALDGKSKIASSNFSEKFLQNSPLDSVQKAMDSIRTSVGSCQTAGRMQTGTPVAASVLLNCTKGYVPLEFAIEPQSPYRIEGISLHPAFWK